METPEEKALRNDYVKNRVLLRVANGGVSHDVWVTCSVGLPDMQEPIDPVVELANDDDGYYVQVFRTRSELEIFVAKLRAAADEAWPSNKTANARLSG